MRSSIIPFVAAFVIACGGSSGGGGGSAGVGTGGTDAGPGSSDGGGAVDAGGATGDGGGNDAGTDGGIGSGGSGADAGSDGGSGSGSGTSADCQGIVPGSLGQSFSFDVPPPRSRPAQCDSATSDESGNIAASNAGFSWKTFSPAGEHLANVPAEALFPQGLGFEGIYMRETSMGPTFPSLAHWTPDGAKHADTPVGSDEAGARVARAWPNGVVTLTGFCAGPPPGTLEVSRFDATGNLVSRARSEGGCAIIGGGVGDANGNALAILQQGGTGGGAGSELQGRWFDHQGKPITPFFRIADGLLYGSSPSDVHNRLIVRAVSGGGAVVARDGVWQWFLPSATTTVQSAPAWLAQNPHTDFTLVRDARAYAILDRGGGDPHVMQLYSTQGNRCGSLTFPEGGLTTGADGSVIAAGGTAGCRKTVWPGLLR
jgi:hypothetical protein